MKRFFSSKFVRVGIVLAVSIPSIAVAQFSDSYNFLKAVREKDLNKASEIISKPGTVTIDTRDSSTGESALHIVTKRRDLGWMGFLLNKGAKVDTRDRNGDTPLMNAAQIGFAEGASILLRVRASVDLGNNGGETPLIRATQNRDSAMVRLLLAGGADPDKRDRLAGKSARDYAKQDSRGGQIIKLIESPRGAAAKAVSGPK
jgi:uncharacterized protein